MRRSTVAIATAALVGSTLAFAPAVGDQQADPVTDHAIVFTENGTATVDGTVEAAGTNLGAPVSEGCSKDPDSYCETVHVTVEQPVEDADPDAIEFGSGQASFTLAPAVPGADFDVDVLETNVDGSERGTKVAESGNFPGCSVLCESPLSAVIGEGCGPDHDECGTWGVTSTDIGDGTKYYLIEVVYYAAGGGYTLDVAYERTDETSDTDGTEDTTDGTDDTAGDEPAAADSAPRVDVTAGAERTGDWNGGQGAELGDALGQDIEAAFLEYADDTYTFTIDVTSLPPVGGVPEITRYTWDFAYNGQAFELDGKFTNYSRGTCDPTAGSCPPPRNPGIGFFALRGNCVTEGSVTTCEELGSVNATFDADEGTIAIPVPSSMLAPDGVAACDTVSGGNVVAQVSAFFSLSTGPQDAALHYTPLVVPHADESLSC